MPFKDVQKTIGIVAKSCKINEIQDSNGQQHHSPDSSDTNHRRATQWWSLGRS